MRISELIGEAPDLADVEMVDDDGNAVAAQRCDQLSGFLDRLGPIVVRFQDTAAAAATRADDRGPSLSEGRRDATPGAACRPRDNRDAAT